MIQAQERALYVEFVGLPGAGKSTVAAEVVPMLARTGLGVVVPSLEIVREGGRTGEAVRPWKNRGRLGRGVRYLGLHLRYVRVAATVYAALLRSGGRDGAAARAARTVFFCIDKARAALAKVERGEAALVLFDQGIANTLREIAADGPPRGSRSLEATVGAAVAALAPGRAYVVHFDVDPETTVARIRQRPGELGPYDRMSPEQARERLRQQAPYSELLLDILQRTSGVAGVLRVDASLPAATNARTIADALLRVVANGAASSSAGSVDPIPDAETVRQHR